MNLKNIIEYDGQWHKKGKDGNCEKFTMRDLKDLLGEQKEELKLEDMALQQLIGMHYSGGKDVYAVCSGMGLKIDEWNKIKSRCNFLTTTELDEIETYFKNL